ncbi:family 43 glycosylhydrolase [Paenibacillus paridis]|uniref:family 43 glycosylhydrolase n=1 Tax=Paenibacillus paridis TaxID=2583376 RepID=UPI001EE43A58|nr:family 43 glycosylhydrolase [Paenibacillus paridis]
MNKSKLLLALLVLCLMLPASLATAYQNPRPLSNEWPTYGSGDPYILKFKGVYYLYVSTKDSEIGIKAWSSTDLVNWTYAGLVATDLLTKAAYAPEVIYWNGYFYMYTSPGGGGHYVLRSESPTGPFIVQTPNKGLTIDGHVFIDDDGQWYFYRAELGQMVAHRMSDPYTFGPGFNTGASVNGGWTEGATVVKRNGKYYMTYTGNHVHSPAYRVDYAVSDNPLTGFVPVQNQNPVLISTEGPTIGLGHNGLVTGPDLDSMYMFYHDWRGFTPEGWPIRSINMDRVVWNGDKMNVLGPTTTSQPDPALPAFQDRFNRTTIGTSWTNVNGGTWGIYNQELMWQDTIGTTTAYKQITNAAAASNYTAEFHAKQMGRGTSASPRYGATFSYVDENNYGVAMLSSKNNRLETHMVVGGVSQGWVNAALPAGFDYSKWHNIRVDKFGSTFKIYVDNMLKVTSSANLGGGKVGYVSEDTHADFAYVAYSNQAGGSSDWDAYKPIPGKIEAVHYMSGGEGVGYHDLTPANLGGQYRSDAVDIRANPEGGYNVGWNQTGEWLKYRVNVAATGAYDVTFRMATTMNGVGIRLWDGSTALTGVVSIPNTGGWDTWRSTTVTNIPMTQGLKELRVEFVTGEADFASMKFHKYEAVPSMNDNFDDNNSEGWKRWEGSWSVSGGQYHSASGTFAKTTIGNDNWANYTIESDIRMNESGGDAGIIVRGKNPANGLERGQGNADFLQGYYAYIKTDGVYLGKQNYNWSNLAGFTTPLAINTWHKMKVVVNGTNIKVYVGDMTTPKLDYNDHSPTAFTHGKIGLRTAYKSTSFDNVILYP